MQLYMSWYIIPFLIHSITHQWLCKHKMSPYSADKTKKDSSISHSPHMMGAWGTCTIKLNKPQQKPQIEQKTRYEYRDKRKHNYIHHQLWQWYSFRRIIRVLRRHMSIRRRVCTVCYHIHLIPSISFAVWLFSLLRNVCYVECFSQQFCISRLII